MTVYRLMSSFSAQTMRFIKRTILTAGVAGLGLLAGCGSAQAPSTPPHLLPAAIAGATASIVCNPYSGAKLTDCVQTEMGRCARYAGAHTTNVVSQAAAACFKGAYARHSGQPNPCGSNAACSYGFTGGVPPEPPSPDPAPPARRAPNFSLTGRTEHGDWLKIEGWFSRPVGPGASDLSTSTLASCPETDGRELVSHLELSVTIESGLSGSVIVGGFVPPAGSSEQSMDFAATTSEGPTCVADTGESEFAIPVGTLEPHESRTVDLWIVLLNAITPTDPHPSSAALAKQGWIVGLPIASVDGAFVKWPVETSDSLPVVR